MGALSGGGGEGWGWWYLNSHHRLVLHKSGIKAFFFRLIIDVKCEMSITEKALTNHPQDDVHKLAGKKS